MHVAYARCQIRVKPTKYPAILGLDSNTPLKKKRATLEVPTVGKSVLKIPALQ